MTLAPRLDKPLTQVVSRRHPMAFGLYMTVFLFGLLFLLNLWGSADHVQQVFVHVNPLLVLSWKLEMVSGGGLGFLALCARPRISPHWPDLADLLHIESIAAIVSAFGWATYATAVISTLPPHVSAGPTLVLFTPLVTAHIFRGVQARREARRLTLLADYLHEVEEQ